MLSKIEPNKQFQVRPKNAFDRERLIIAIWSNGYVYSELRGMIVPNPGYPPAYKHYKKLSKRFPYFGFFAKHGENPEYKHIVCGFSRKYANANKDRYPIISVDEAIEWLTVNHGPYYIDRNDIHLDYSDFSEYDDIQCIGYEAFNGE